KVGAPAQNLRQQEAVPLSPLKEAPLKEEMTAEGKPLPRDLRIAKARAYRETQARPQQQPEQLSMEMDAGIQNMEAKSPFESDNLDIPAYLRKHMQDADPRRS